MLTVGISGPSVLAPHRSRMGTGGGRCRRYRQHPPRGPAIDVFNFDGGRCRTLPAAPPKGPAINVFNFRGGCYRTCRQHTPGVPPLTSSTSVVAADGPCRQHPQRARHRRLQLQWWPLLNLPPAPPGGPPSTSPTSEPLAPAAPGVRRRLLSKKIR
jgi:hypothetical protein